MKNENTRKIPDFKTCGPDLTHYQIPAELLMKIREGLNYSDHNGLLDMVDRVISGGSEDPDWQIVGCNFQGSNADGSDPIQLEGDGTFLRFKALKLVGWTCYGPTYKAPKKWWELWE